MSGEEERHLKAARLADRQGESVVADRPPGLDLVQGRRRVEKALGHSAVPPDSGRQGVAVARQQLLGAARVVGDGDHDLQARRLARQPVESAFDVGARACGLRLAVGEARAGGRQQRVDQHQRVADQGEARHLVAPLDARVPLGVARGPAPDARRDLVHGPPLRSTLVTGRNIPAGGAGRAGGPNERGAAPGRRHAKRGGA